MVNLILLALILSALGLATGGVFLLFGPGWTLIAAAAGCLFLSVVIAKGYNG